MEYIGDRLKELMLINKIDSKVLSKAIGKSISTVNRWKNDSVSLSLSGLILLCNYFNCSVSYLLGHTDTLLDYSPYPCPNFYGQFRKALKQKSITRYKFIKETRFKDEHFTKWKKGADPSLASLIDIASYLDCSIDYLIGRDR